MNARNKIAEVLAARLYVVMAAEAGGEHQWPPLDSLFSTDEIGSVLSQLCGYSTTQDLVQALLETDEFQRREDGMRQRIEELEDEVDSLNKDNNRLCDANNKLEDELSSYRSEG